MKVPKMKQIPEMGKMYEVSMPREKEFGGPLRVLKVTKHKVAGAFEFDGVLDTDGLLEFTIGKKHIRYAPVQFDAFLDDEVEFKAMKQAPIGAAKCREILKGMKL